MKEIANDDISAKHFGDKRVRRFHVETYHLRFSLDTIINYCFQKHLTKYNSSK